jgi:hypothetical protein
MSDGNKKIKTAHSGKKVEAPNDVIESDNPSSDSKKPSGYTFLTPDKTRAICKAVNSNLTSGCGSEVNTRSTNYIRDYLRLPSYIQTLVVPMFSFNTQTDDDGTKSSNGNKFISKQSQKDVSRDTQQQDVKKKQKIPSGTQKSVAIETPHGWQAITPEQYGGVIASLEFPPEEERRNFGAVGLFDCLDITSQVNSLFHDDDPENGSVSGFDPEAVPTMKKQSLKKITASFQKCTSWSSHIQNTLLALKGCNVSSLWAPVNIFSAFLPEHVLSKSFSVIDQKSGALKMQNLLSESSHVAIVGWEAFASQLHHNQKRTVLQKLMKTIQCMPLSESKQASKQFLLLAVNDVASIVNAAREGVSIIGTDLIRSMSCQGLALVLNFTPSTANVELPTTSNTTCGGRIDLKNKQYSNDHRPLLHGCTCLTCRARKATDRPVGYQHFQKDKDVKTATYSPSFSRAYIHHLIQAKEMLADTLLFIHNLHQMVSLFRELSEAKAAAKLESLCQWVEHQL